MEREELENGAKQGFNDFGTIGYRGPCPQRYPQILFQGVLHLIPKFNLSAKITKAELLKVMDGHIIDEGSIMGTFTR